MIQLSKGLKTSWSAGIIFFIRKIWGSEMQFPAFCGIELVNLGGKLKMLQKIGLKL
jgi:hypothetical protein